jgi:hypothetical protein
VPFLEAALAAIALRERKPYGPFVGVWEREDLCQYYAGKEVSH